jgi:uncharacterized Zn finger protein
MGYSIKIPNGILCMSKVDFECPSCGFPYYEEDYYTRLVRNKYPITYLTCKRCKNKIGISSDIKGDVVVWLKENETKINL